MPPSAARTSRSTTTLKSEPSRSDDPYHGVATTEVPTIEVHEAFNPDHQGYIGFIPPKDGPVHDIHKTAKRIAAELVLLPKERRGTSSYDDEYLKKTSGCRSWPRLRCAHCDCWKRELE